MSYLAPRISRLVLEGEWLVSGRIDDESGVARREKPYLSPRVIQFVVVAEEYKSDRIKKDKLRT